MIDWTDASTIVVGIATSIAAGATVLSKIAKGYSADRQAVAKDNTSQTLYSLLLEENKRMAERNIGLEKRNDLLIERLNKLEVTHAKLIVVETENLNLKSSIERKDAQLLALLRQQKTDRELFVSKFQEQANINRSLRLQIKGLQASLISEQVPERRLDDVHPSEPLQFPKDENNE